MGQGGGDEARRSQFLGGLQQRLGAKTRARASSTTCASSRTPSSPTSVDGNFPYGQHPEAGTRAASCSTPAASPRPRRCQASPVPGRRGGPSPSASNELMIDAEHSTTGHPLLVGGPQIGYFFPGLTYEIDMHAPRPRLAWRDLGAVPRLHADRPRRRLRHHADLAERRHHRPVRGDALRRQRRQVPATRASAATMGTFDAGTLNGDPVNFRTTVHGPVVGYATVDGREVAISSKRSSYGKDVLDLLFNRRLSTARCTDPKSFFKAASLTPQTFNSFYIDSKHIAEFTTGRLPVRAPHVDPGLPTVGTGQYEWRGFLGKDQHIHGVDPKQRNDRQLEQQRRPRLRRRRRRVGRATARSPASTSSTATCGWSRDRRASGRLASVTSAMNAAATQDVRAIDTVPLLARLLKGIDGAERSRPQQMLDLLVAWRHARRQPARRRPRRRDRRPRRRDHGRRLAEDRRRVHGAAARLPARRAQLACSRASTSRRAASTTAGTSTSTGHPDACSGCTVRAAVRKPLLRQGQAGRLPGDGLGAIRRPATS